ncbi:MAG: DNA-binding protein [Spirochaetia bacterium]|nr:DNA-binding protein [Spirochaetia bacterium]
MKWRLDGDVLYVVMRAGEVFPRDVLPLFMGKIGADSAAAGPQLSRPTGIILTGLGMVKNVELGLGWYKDKEVGYERDFISEPNELLALSGFFIKDTERPCHIHAVLGGRESMARGGHLFSCEVFTFLEMAVRMEDTPLFRQMVDGLPELSW